MHGTVRKVRVVVGMVSVSVLLLLATLPAQASMSGGLQASVHCVYAVFPSAQVVPCSGTGSISFSGTDVEGNSFTASCVGCAVDASLNSILNSCFFTSVDGVEEAFLTLSMPHVTVLRRVPSGNIVTNHATLEVTLFALRTGTAVAYEGVNEIPTTTPTSWALVDDGVVKASADVGGVGSGTWIPDSTTTCFPPVSNFGVTLGVAASSVA